MIKHFRLISNNKIPDHVSKCSKIWEKSFQFKNDNNGFFYKRDYIDAYRALKLDKGLIIIIIKIYIEKEVIICI